MLVLINFQKIYTTYDDEKLLKKWAFAVSLIFFFENEIEKKTVKI